MSVQVSVGKMMKNTKYGRIPTRWELDRSMRRMVMDDLSLLASARQQLQEYIPLSQSESNIFGDPSAKIDPEYHVTYKGQPKEFRFQAKRKQIVCCIVQQLYAEHLGLA